NSSLSVAPFRCPAAKDRSLTAALACAALGADAARASANYFVAAAMRTDDIHEHVPECFLDTIGVTAAVAQHLRLAVVRRMARDHVDQFFFAGPRQLR